MTERAVSIAVYAVILVLGLALEAAALTRPATVPTLRRALVWVLRRRSTQLGLVVAWWWLGWHFITGR